MSAMKTVVVAGILPAVWSELINCQGHFQRKTRKH